MRSLAFWVTSGLLVAKCLFLGSWSCVSASGNPLPVPYIHQVSDTPEEFYGAAACAPTSAVMVLASYGRLAFTDPAYDTLGSYVCKPYTYHDPLYGKTQDFKASKRVHVDCGSVDVDGAGAWGYIWSAGETKVKDRLCSFLEAQGVATHWYESPDAKAAEALVRQQIAAGHPLVARTYLTKVGHYVVIVGFEDDPTRGFLYLVNDPFGEHPYTDSCLGTKATQPVAYTYAEMNLGASSRGLIATLPEASAILRIVRVDQSAADEGRTYYQPGDVQEKWVRVTAGLLRDRVVKTYVRTVLPNGEARWAYRTSADVDPSEPLLFSSTKTPLYPGTWAIQDSDWHWDTHTFRAGEQAGHWTWEFSYEDASTGTVLLSSEAAYEVAESLSSIDAGLQWLRSSQKSDGSWSESTGITALALLSFFNAGVSPDDPTDTNKDGVPDIQKGMAFLASKFDQASGSFSGDEGGGTSYICYDTALCILGLIAADRASGVNHYQAGITRAKDYLLSVQLVADQGSANYGGWGYPRAGWADLSNTQWVVMALNAANDYLGLSPALSDSSSWAGKLVSFLQHCQMSDGGFDYQSGWFKKSVGSMSMAGLWSLLLAGVPETDQGVVRVREWIQANYTLGENPGRGTAALFYYYVTLAKALTMASWATVTDSAGAQHNWYSELAAKLGTLQKAAGNWVNDNSDEWENNADLCTAYALLALETQQLPSGEQLSWVLTLHSPGTLHVYAPDGAHVGPSNAGAGVDEDIPGSSYIVSPDGEQVISISGLDAGSYRVELVGTTGGAYTLASVLRQSGRDVSSKSFTGSLVPGQVRATNVVFTAMEGAATQFMNDLQAVPSGLTATSGNQTVSLSWRPFSETGFALAGYNVYRSTATGGGYSKTTTAAVSATSYRDAGLTNDVTYYYVVTAVSSTGSETPYSRQVNATPALAVPGQTGQVICGPNPVGPAGVAFYYQLPERTAGAEIVILDLSGRLVFRTHVDPSGTRYPAGGTWDPVDLNGIPLGNGPYSFVLVADGRAVGHGKMVIQR